MGSGAFFAFGGAQGFAGGLGRVFGGGIFGKAGGANLACGFGLAFQCRQLVALGEADGGGRRRFGAGNKPVPTPQIAARRHQRLAGFEAGLQGRTLIGEHQACHRQPAAQRSGRLDEVAERLGAFGQVRIEVKGAQIAPVVR